MVTQCLGSLHHSSETGVEFPPPPFVHSVCRFYLCFQSFLQVLYFYPQYKDMHGRLLGILKLSVVDYSMQGECGNQTLCCGSMCAVIPCDVLALKSGIFSLFSSRFPEFLCRIIDEWMYFWHIFQHQDSVLGRPPGACPYSTTVYSADTHQCWKPQIISSELLTQQWMVSSVTMINHYTEIEWLG